jgi:DNA-binding SARP family transcriptional activator
VNLTVTEQKIYDVLSDWYPHSVDELTTCLWDDMNDGPGSALRFHMSNLRKKIGPLGQDVVHRGVNGKSTYRLVRHVLPGE